MEDKEKLRLIYNIAYEYYINDLKQKEIADKLDINRVQVSRYLNKARELGLVKIDVINPLSEENNDIEEELVSIFPVERAKVATIPKWENNILLDALAEKANDYINETFTNTDKIGVGWGTTIFRVAKVFSTNNDYQDIEFIPVTGSSFEFSKEFQPNNISFMLSEAFNGKSYPLMAPFYVETKEEYNTLVKNPSVKKVIKLWDELDKILVGIGSSFARTPLLKMDVLKEDELTKLLNFKQVGDILTHYFNIEGEFYELEINERLINLPLDYLDKVNEVIGVAGGKDKVSTLIGALSSGKVDTIITDNFTAKEVIKNVER